MIIIVSGLFFLTCKVYQQPLKSMRLSTLILKPNQMIPQEMKLLLWIPLAVVDWYQHPGPPLDRWAYLFISSTRKKLLTSNILSRKRSTRIPNPEDRIPILTMKRNTITHTYHPRMTEKQKMSLENSEVLARGHKWSRTLRVNPMEMTAVIWSIVASILKQWTPPIHTTLCSQATLMGHSLHTVSRVCKADGGNHLFQRVTSPLLRRRCHVALVGKVKKLLLCHSDRYRV